MKRGVKRIGRAFGFSEVNDSLAQIKDELKGNRKAIEDVTELADRAKKLEAKIDRLEKINELYFDVLFKDDSETNLEARKRFFKKIPETNGDLRLIQLGSIKLLEEFDKICKKKSINYWLTDGTLLGAIRSNKIIPWDDDVDVDMLRDDLHKLQKAVKGTGFKVNVVYDPYVVCKQVRFMSKNEANPCFVDIFIYDYGTNGRKEDWESWKQLRKTIVDSVHDSKEPEMQDWLKHGVINSTSKTKTAQYVEVFYETNFGDIKGDVKGGGPLGIVQKAPKNKKYYIVNGLDNMTPVCRPESPRVYEVEDIFPLKTISFEGRDYPCQNHPEKYLEDIYGDYYEIPNDLVSHFRHTTIDDISRKAIQDFINK